MPDFLKLTDNNLQYLDALTYASLQSFNNSDNNCFAKHETIGKRVGLSKRFVIDSIKRLELAEFITVERSDKKKVSNQYYFADKIGKWFISTSKVPRAIFEAIDLTIYEKAMFICLRQFFNHGLLTCIEGIPFFAKYLGLSYSTVSKQFNSLIDKGYIAQKHIIRKGSKKNFVKYYFTDKINWDYYDFERPVELPIIVVYPKLKVA